MNRAHMIAGQAHGAVAAPSGSAISVERDIAHRAMSRTLATSVTTRLVVTERTRRLHETLEKRIKHFGLQTGQRSGMHVVALPSELNARGDIGDALRNP